MSREGGGNLEVTKMPEPDRHIFTDSEIDIYQGYMPDEWGELTFETIAADTVLERLLLDLALAWRTAAYTAQMPASSIRAMHAAALGRGNFVSPDSSIVAYSEKIAVELTKQIPELTEDRALRSRLMASLVTITGELRDRTAKVKAEFPIEPIWAQFMNDTAFRLSLWSSQRLAFVAFYNAYEVFIVDCVKVATGLTSLRTQAEEFRKGLRSAFTKDIADTCWFNSELNIARLVRHALTHNGGRQTEDLKKHKHAIKLIGEDLQIVPEDNHRMLRHLRKSVDSVIAVAQGDRKFIAPAAHLPPPSDD